MTEVGNADHAREIAEFFYSNNPANMTWREKVKGRTPRAFKRIGDGSYRVAYLHKATGIVYKVDKYRDTHGSMNNKGEANNYPVIAEKVKDKGCKHVKIPATFGHEFMLDVHKVCVVAMEFVAGAIGTEAIIDYTGPAYREYRALGVSDSHGGNYVVDDEGTIWPIDLGGYV